MFRLEPIAFLLKTGLDDLARRHWDEVDETGLPYNPTWEMMQKWEDEGSFRVISVRESGELIGYASVLLRVMHQTNEITAFIQDPYILPEHRKGMLGVQLLKEAEKLVKPLNVKKLVVAEPITENSIGLVYKRLGYTPQETLWSKVLGE